MTDDTRWLLGFLLVGVIAGVLALLLVSCKPTLSGGGGGYEPIRGHTYKGSSFVHVVVGDPEVQALVERLQAELAECREACPCEPQGRP